MPEANYLLSVSWGYIKVCGAYLRSLSGFHCTSVCCAALRVISKEKDFVELFRILC